jgi:RimJ/RimL family protein N-acetyltransferase
MDGLTLRPWSVDDLPLLRAANAPAMTSHLNGPESEEALVARHERYLHLVGSGEARMFVIADEDGGPLGSIGCWRIDWRNQPVWETGWFVLPRAQGRGVATRALTLLIADLCERRAGRRLLLAFPSADNAASNAVCRRADFVMMGTTTMSFRGAELTVNEWAFDLAGCAAGGKSSTAP